MAFHLQQGGPPRRCAGRRLLRPLLCHEAGTRQARDRDKIFEEFGARLFVDTEKFLFLNGTTLEYEETLMRQGFVFQNPNAARKPAAAAAPYGLVEQAFSRSPVKRCAG